MSDDRKKIYPKKPTGTVPKIKYRNNTSQLNQDGTNHNTSSKNLAHYDDARDCYQSKLKFYGNTDLLKRNFLLPQSFPMENTGEDQRSTPKQNGVAYTQNGVSSTPNTSASVSRRNSTGTAPKTENVAKYPDKKHIEDRLCKIREYLNATSSLITNMKTTDDQSHDDQETESLRQMFNDLKDSEAKLLVMLSDIENAELEPNKPQENGLDTMDKSELERRYDQANQEVQLLQEQENILLNLQLAAESQLRDARNAHQKLAVHNKGNNQPSNSKTSVDTTELNGILELMEHHNLVNKNSNENYFDSVRELDERIRSFNETRGRPSGSNINENVQSQIEALQQHIGMLRDSNDNRNQLIQILDNRDAQLRTEHIELQGRLVELQNKKSQVDHLVSQIQSMNEESEDEDVGTQVRRIVNMKDQLAKLKDMLDAVKTTESMMDGQNLNESDIEVQETAHSIPAKSDNLKRSTNRTLSESNSSTRLENPGFRSTNVRKVAEKQVNKSSIKEREKLKLQEELQAKKRELEELMYKHKAVSSNLNQDVHNENKTDHFNIQFESDADSWRPVPNTYNVASSDSEGCPEEDVNEYSEFNSSGDTNNTSLLQPMPVLNYPTSNYIKHRDLDVRSARSVPSPRNVSKTPDRSARSSSITTPVHQHRERGSSNSEQDVQSKTQMQKKLELIRSVCDSMLANNTPDVQQLRNNLTPSPLYSEPRPFSTPNSQYRNVLSTVNTVAEHGWIPASVPSYPPADMTNYQNFLATNTLQTQAFMLNTLNQCCQMMWLQQRELASLRSTVSLLLERFPIEHNAAPSYMNTNPIYPPTGNPADTRPPPNVRPTNNSKSNQVSSATSLPNLSHMQVSHANMDPACANNLHTARVVESNLNNSVVHNHQNEIGDHVNNMHTLNQPIPTQIWNGQALNNQVAPGNRANNYWDNFRSYSRQNLLSTKSNDGLQNSASDGRSHNTIERSSSYTLPSASVPKLNTEHQDSGNASIENTPRRRACFKTIRASSGETIDIVHNIPPDVLNVNQSQKSNENNDLFEIPISMINEENISNVAEVSSFPNSCRHNSQSGNMNIHQDQLHKEAFNYRQNRYRNLWQNNQDGQKCLQSLYSMELRENIFRGVASLIAANEERPHFLIQLLRGLQKVTSDQMRCRTLQSLQSLISNGEESLDLRQDQDTESIYSDYREVLSRLWPQSPKNSANSLNDSMTSNALDIDYMLSEVLLFLNANAEEPFQIDFVDVIRDLLVQSRLSTIPKDEIIQRYFTSLLECSVASYRGKLIKDVKINILKAIEDLLRMDLRKFIREDQETGESTDEDENLLTNNLGNGSFELNPQNGISEEGNPPQMQNGDLAEADQSRLEMEDEEEEGAVGGVLNMFIERSPNHTQIAPDEIEITKIEFPLDTEAEAEFVEQGLDQVPTRLTTRSRTRSTTPNKDRSTSRSDATEQF